jgi:hypothetical protein
MYLMEAISALNHSHIVLRLLCLSDLLIAKLAASILPVSLHLLVVGLGSFSLSSVHEEVHLIFHCICIYLLDLFFWFRRRINLHIIGRLFLLLEHASVVSDLILLHWTSTSISFSLTGNKHIEQ